MKNNFFTGLLVLIPMAVIFWIAEAVFGFLWQVSVLLPEQWQPSEDLALVFRVLFFLGILFVTVVSISLLGLASKHYLGKKLLEGLQYIIKKVPVLGTIYVSLNQIMSSIADSSRGERKFSRVVYFEYPRKGSWVIAFVTGSTRPTDKLPGHLNIFVPTVPNPTSGFHLIVPESDVLETNFKVDEAFKIILSLGIVQPGQKR